MSSQQQRTLAFAQGLQLQQQGKNFTIMPHIVDEGESAFKVPLAQRLKGSLLYAAVSEGDHVVAIKLDRMFRNLMDGAKTMDRWLAMGVTVHFVDGLVIPPGAIGKCILHVLLAFAELESGMISERTKAGIAAARIEGNGKHRKRTHGNCLHVSAYGITQQGRAVVRLAVYLRSVHKWSVIRIENHIEQILCRRDGRPYKKERAFFPRKYSAMFIRNSYELYTHIRNQQEFAGLPSSYVFARFVELWDTPTITGIKQGKRRKKKVQPTT